MHHFEPSPPAKCEENGGRFQENVHGGRELTLSRGLLGVRPSDSGDEGIIDKGKKVLCTEGSRSVRKRERDGTKPLAAHRKTVPEIGWEGR